METVGVIYMAASGAPERTVFHAQNVADVSLAMMKKIRGIKTPSGTDVEVRIGRNENFSNVPELLQFNINFDT